MINIQKDIKLSNYSTFKIGGPAKEFVEVKNEKEFFEAITYAKENNLKIFILGGGSNVLFDDKGFNGLVVKLKGLNKSIEIISEDESIEEGEGYGQPLDVRIKCWAGESLSSLVNFMRDNGIGGMEWAVGIPGTVGGAIAGNAGAFGGCVSDSIESVRLFRLVDLPFPSENKVLNYSSKKCDFGYRNSIFKVKDNMVILSSKFKFKKRSKDEIELSMREYVQKRLEKQPKNWYGCAGSYFKNPIVEKKEIIDKFKMDTGNEAVDNRIPAGWLIDQLGVKGEKIGNIQISETNANFLLNLGNGTAEEVIIAAGIIKQKMRKSFGIQLKEEIKYVNY